MKTKYFDHGLKEHLAEDCFFVVMCRLLFCGFVGHMAATALLQNGQAPKHFSEELLSGIFFQQ